MGFLDELWQLRALLLEQVLRLAVTPVTTAARASTRERDILTMKIKNQRERSQEAELR